MQSILDKSDVFVLPSLKEGMSNALLEAMALKKCCIVSDIPQNKALISDKTGMVFKTGSAESLARKMKAAFSSHKLRADLGKRASDVVKRRFSMESTLKSYEEVLRWTRRR